MPTRLPLRVVQVVTSTHRRGAETFAVDLGAALAERVDSVETVALEPASGGATLDLPVLSAHRGRDATRALRRRVRGADVVVAHGSATLAATAIATAAPGRARPPFVYRLIGDPTYWTPDALRRLAVGALLHRAAAVATYHSAAADELVVRYRLPPRRVHVIGKGIDPTPFPRTTAVARATARASLGIDDGAGPVIAWIGALRPEKDPGLAVDVAHHLARTRPGATLVVAGDGPLRAELEQTAAGSAVRFLGAVDSPATVLAAADVLLLTSRTEGVPGVVLEAGLTGLPVVTVDVGGVGELVVDGATGRVLRGRDHEALAAAVEEAHRCRDEWGTTAAARLRETADIAAVADRWLDLLTAVTAPSSRRR